MTLQANQAALFLEVQDTVTIGAPQVSTTLGGLPTWRASLESLDQEMGQAPRATFVVGFGRSTVFGQDLRLEQAARLVAPGQVVRATLLRGGVIPGAERGDLVLFEGRITGIEMKLDAHGEQLLVQAEDLAADVLACRIGGQRIATASGATARIPGMDLVFNPDGRPNAAAQLYAAQEGTSYRIFASESPAGAVAWTLDEAVAFLLAEFGASDVVSVPSRGEVMSLLGVIPVRDVNLEGMTLGDALQTLLDMVGGGFVVTAQPDPAGISRRLELWLPGAASTTWLSHQVPGSLFQTSQTDFQALAFASEFASMPQRYVAQGDRKVYETTFDLVAGWDNALASYDADRYSPSTNDGFDSVRDVHRKWVLNEAGEYSASPYNRGTAPDLSAVFEGDPFVRRHRRLLPCLSYDALGRGYGVYAEVSLDGGTTWGRLAVSAKVLEDECGLYLTEDTLPPSYLRAAIRGQVRVRVTASIESDSCLTAERSATDGATTLDITRYLDVSAGYRYRKVAATSRFHGQCGADEVDDGARLQALVDAAFEADRRNPTPGRVEMPWLTLGHRVGQRVRGVRGRRLDLAQDQPGYETDPVIRRIHFRLAPTPATELELV